MLPTSQLHEEIAHYAKTFGTPYAGAAKCVARRHRNTAMILAEQKLARCDEALGRAKCAKDEKRVEDELALAARFAREATEALVRAQAADGIALMDVAASQVRAA